MFLLLRALKKALSFRCTSGCSKGYSSASSWEGRSSKSSSGERRNRDQRQGGGEFAGKLWAAACARLNRDYRLEFKDWSNAWLSLYDTLSDTLALEIFVN